MNKKIRTDAVDHLIDALLCLETKEESYNFLEDLCTSMNCSPSPSVLKSPPCCAITGRISRSQRKQAPRQQP